MCKETTYQRRLCSIPVAVILDNDKWFCDVFTVEQPHNTAENFYARLYNPLHMPLCRD